jgi:hypothetical protein
MRRESRDPWRLPVLERLGVQLRDLESAERRARAKRAGRRRRRISISAGFATALIAILALLVAGRVAHALSPVNRAPGAAAASESVHFNSAISLKVGSQLKTFTELGEIDFATRDYSTILEVGQGGETSEERRVDGVLYVAQPLRGRSRHAPIRWLAFRVAREASTTFAAAPESDEFTNPLVLLDELGGTRAPVIVLGSEHLHGVLTTRYRLHTNLASLLSASPGAPGQPASYRTVSVTLTVWLDAQGRPRQVDETVAGASVGAASMTTVTDFTAYGRPVAVRAPSEISVTSERSAVARNPLRVSPGRIFEGLVFAHR